MGGCFFWGRSLSVSCQCPEKYIKTRGKHTHRLWSRWDGPLEGGIMDLFCPPPLHPTIPNPDFRTCCSLFRPLSLLPPSPRSHPFRVSSRPEHSGRCVSGASRVPPTDLRASSFFRRGLSGGHVTRLPRRPLTPPTSISNFPRQRSTAARFTQPRNAFASFRFPL